MNLNDVLNIKVKISDRSAIEKITPDMIAEYLEFHGWKRKKEAPWLEPGQAYTWRHPKKRKDFLVAHDTNLRDYIIRTSELIAYLAEF